MHMHILIEDRLTPKCPKRKPRPPLKKTLKKLFSGSHPPPAPGLRGGLPFARTRFGSFGAHRRCGVLCVSIVGAVEWGEREEGVSKNEAYFNASIRRSHQPRPRPPPPPRPRPPPRNRKKKSHTTATSSPSRARRARPPSSSCWAAQRRWGLAWDSSSCFCGRGSIFKSKKDRERERKE